MFHYLLKVWYIGTKFRGSQRLSGKLNAMDRTVEGEIIEVLKKTNYITSARNNRFKAGQRTDRGVHAREAMFSFISKRKLYVNIINDQLGSDIGINHWAKIEPKAYPRHDCEWKEYRYFLPKIGKISKKTMETLRLILEEIQGTHNFTLFSKTDATKNKSPYITLRKCTFEEMDNYLVFKFQSQSFLWQQIRRTMNFINKIIVNETPREKALQKVRKRLKENYIKSNWDDREKPLLADGLVLWKAKLPDSYEIHSEPKLQWRRRERLEPVFHRKRAQIYAIESILKDADVQEEKAIQIRKKRVNR